MNKNMFLKGITEKYSDEMLMKRIETEGNVIACLYKDVLLLDETKLNKDCFITKDGRFFFSLINDLRNKKKFNAIDEVTILSNSSDAVIESFEKRGGFETISDMVDAVKLDNFEIYLDQLYRENIILKLHDDGFNLNKNVNINGKNSIKPLDIFREMTSEEVLSFYEVKLSEYQTGESSKVLEESFINFEDDFLDQCVDGNDSGVPFNIAGKDINGSEINCFPFLSNQILGFLEGTLSMNAGFSSVGKSTWWITVIMGLLYQDRKIAIISNEENLKKYKIKFLVWILAKYCRYYKLTKSKLSAGDINDNDREQYEIVKRLWNSYYKNKIMFIEIEDADMSLVKKKVRYFTLKYGCDTFLYDTFKIQENDMSNNSRTDLALVRDTRELLKLAKKYKIIMLASVQLAEHMKGKLFLDASVLSNSKQIKEVLENLFMMRSIYDEELDPKSKYFIKPFQLKKINDVWQEEPYTPDRNAVYRILFVEKDRNGSNSSDTGVAYLLKFDGAHSIFREVAQCRPRHGMIQ